MAPIFTNKQHADHASEELRKNKLSVAVEQLFNSLGSKLHDKLMERLRWVEIKGGEVLFRQGEAGDSLYILVTGRMKAVLNANSLQERAVGEISQGECVGEMSLITGELRSATIFAMRDCMLAKLAKEDFQQLLKEHPEIVLSLSRLIINRLNYTMHHAPAPAKTFNLALVPASPDVPMRQFVDQLLQALKANGSVRHLSQEQLPDGLHVMAAYSNDLSFALHTWLTEQEMNQDCVLYEADCNDSSWTQQCLRQADKIIIVTQAAKGAELSALEQELLFNPDKEFSQSRELVVLYPETTQSPNLTHKVLASREVSRHYNIRFNDGRHMQRLARMMMNKGVGLVLSGGGAKGFAHLGIFKALHEAGIPIDMVCGTSMGSIVAAAIAHEWPINHIMETGRNAFLVDKPMSDYTLPVVSLLKGHKLQKTNKKYFGDVYVEDLWLNFFCVSGNYTTSKMVVHERGPLWKSVSASVSIPGVLPPVVEGNHLLVDGSVFNNFPVDLMKERFGGKLIGVDLLADKEYTLNYTQIPGGWPMFLSKFFPFLKRYKVPSIGAIMIKSAILSSTVHQRRQIADLELFLSPPVANFGLLDMKNYEKIVRVGYEYASEHLKSIDATSLLLKDSPQPLAAKAVTA